MIKVRERFPNFIDPGEDYNFWEGEFDSLFEVFNCELVERWKIKLGDKFARIAINSYPDPTGILIDDYMLTVYDKKNNTYNIGRIK
jgi:hypothetical protein